MTSRPTTSEAKTLEQFRVALENTEEQPQVAATMAEYGYDSTKMAEGNALYQTARLAFDQNKTETDESLAAYDLFDAKKITLQGFYAGHRKKAKVAFAKDPITAEKLAITGLLPDAYTNWLEAIRKFYNTALADVDIQSKLARFKITTDNLTATKAIIAEVEALRSAYLKEKGESEDATEVKDAALATLDEWMGEFYAVAKIALEDHPQLLEALGKVVR